MLVSICKYEEIILSLTISRRFGPLAVSHEITHDFVAAYLSRELIKIFPVNSDPEDER